MSRIAAAVRGPGATDPIGLMWLVIARWVTLAAGVAAIVAGTRALDAHAPVRAAAAVLVLGAASNLWLMWRIRRGDRGIVAAAGALVCADVVALTWLLLTSGGVLNPVSAFYLAQIVVAALVLGPTWTGVVTGLSVGGYAMLFLVQSDELRAAQGMHPEIAAHMRGMWLAFAIVAVVIGVLVTRLAIAVARRDRALFALRDRNARASRAAALGTAVAGAAHELGTPLATMAVAAGELEHALDAGGGVEDLKADVRLIRREIDRCRALLTSMAARLALPLGEAPATCAIADVLDDALGRVPAAERGRVVREDDGSTVVWPRGPVAQALGNIVRNALQASAPEETVRIGASSARDGRVTVVVADRGGGMAPDVLARAGEPFFTTKSPNGGIGLGLYVTRSTVEQLGGTLEVRSAPGEGTTVTMVLPRDVVVPTP